MVYGLSLVSTSVEHVLEKRGTVSLVLLFVYILRYPSLLAGLSSAHQEQCCVVRSMHCHPLWSCAPILENRTVPYC